MRRRGGGFLAVLGFPLEAGQNIGGAGLLGGAKAFARQRFRDIFGVLGDNQLVKRGLRRLGLGLLFAQSSKRRLGVGDGVFARERRLEAAAARGARRMGHARDAAAAFQLGETRRLVAHPRVQLADLRREQLPRSRRGVGVGLQHREPLGGLLGQILAPALQCGHGPLLEIDDLRSYLIEALRFLTLLRHRQRQGFAGAFDRGSGVAHLLIEQGQRVLVLDPLFGLEGAPAHEGHNCLEHLLTPVMNDVHNDDIARL